MTKTLFLICFIMVILVGCYDEKQAEINALQKQISDKEESISDLQQDF